jgi:hypothetical protein
VTEELGAVEEELVDRMFGACEEVGIYAKKRWGYGCDEVFGEGCCRWEEDEKVVEVVLYDGSLLVDEEDIENIRRMLEKHGLFVRHVAIEVRAGDYIAEVKIRFHVTLRA